MVVLLNCLRFSWAWHQQHPARPQEWWCKQRKGSSDQCKALKIGCVPNVFPRTLSRRNKAILHWRVSQFHSEQFCRRVYEKGINYPFPYLIKTIKRLVSFGAFICYISLNPNTYLPILILVFSITCYWGGETISIYPNGYPHGLAAKSFNNAFKVPIGCLKVNFSY